MPPVPATIGRYTVQRVLGRGGMGTVYLAIDPLIEREVAIKVLPLAGADEYSDRLIAEARVSGRLIHPNIVGVFDLGEEDGQPFVVMPYVPGRTVASILTDRDRPKIAAKLRWMAQLCDALAYAHERRVIHRDIKPTNLLIDEQQNLRVLDFGIAKVLTTSQIQFTSVGTPAYMAPEQYSSAPVDPRTDVFAAGLVFYELITHRRALTGTTPAQIYGQLMAGQLPRVLDAAPGTDPALAAVCARAMARDPKDRFQTARAFADALEEAQASSVASTAATVVGVPAAATLPATAIVPPPAPRPVQNGAAVAPPDVAEPSAVVASDVYADDAAGPPPSLFTLPDPRWLMGAGVVLALSLAGYVLAGRSLPTGTPSVPPVASPPAARVHTATPALRLRPAPDWIRGYQGTNCQTPIRGYPGLYGDPPTVLHFTPTKCSASGQPNTPSSVLFRETAGDRAVIWRDFPPEDAGPSLFSYPSADGTRLAMLTPETWTFLRTADGRIERVVKPQGGPLEVSVDGSAMLYVADAGQLGVYDVPAGEASLFPATTDGQPLTAPAKASGISATGRYVLFASTASNVAGATGQGTNAFYRYDREAKALFVVNGDTGEPKTSLVQVGAVGDDGDWIAYMAWTRAEMPGAPPAPAGMLYLYAYQASTGRTVFIDSLREPTSLGDTYLAPLAIIDANVLVYQRNRGAAAADVEYLWMALPDGTRQMRTVLKATLQQPPSTYPYRNAPQCLSWTDLTAWCLAP